MKIKVIPIFLLIIAFSNLHPKIGASSPIQELSAGFKYFNACHSVSIRESASSWASVVGQLKFGAEIKIQNLYEKFELEDSDENSKEKLELRDDLEDIDEEMYTRFIWAGIQQGIIPTSCIVSQKELLNSEEMEGRVKKITSSKAKRNFSEEEKGDQAAMRGAAGKAKFGKPNFTFVDGLINKAKEQNFNDVERTKLFRESGRLGEFKE